MRNALATTLYELAKADERVCVVVADISPAGAMERFRADFPDRFINVGVAEASMIGLAAGMAQRGFKVFCYTIATFALFRCFEQVRVDLAYQNLPVTIIGMGAGLAYSTLGATHQATEDVAVAVAMPNMTVLAPCDPAETTECVHWCAGRESGGPVYLRIGKAGEPDLTTAAEPWAFGKLRMLHRGDEGGTCVVGYGPVMAAVVEAARAAGGHAAVLAACTVAPVCADDVEWMCALYKKIVVVEEASGAPLAARIRVDCEMLTEIDSFALPREFCHLHGTREELLDHYGLTAEKIIAALT